MSEPQPTAKVYSDSDFLDPLDSDGWTSLLIVADRVGCSVPTANRRLQDLADDREVAFKHPPNERRIPQREVRRITDE